MVDPKKPGAQAQVLIRMIEENNFRRVVEVGVWKGKTCKKVLVQCHDQLEGYWAVDPWKKYGENEGGRMPKLTQEDWNTLYQYTLNLKTYFSKLHVLKMKSSAAVRQFEEGFFDLVFIDARHDYRHVRADINLWLPFVRKGGILCGHDYTDSRKFRGVIKAVKEQFGSDFEVIPDAIWVHQVKEIENE